MWKYKIGTVVRETERHVQLRCGDSKIMLRQQMFGHIVGFAQAEYKNDRGHDRETILIVRWESGSEYRVPPQFVLTEQEFNEADVE
jgi:hypothetical protein